MISRSLLARLFLGFNLIFIIFIFWRGRHSDAFQPQITADNLAYYHGRSVKIRGRVCEEADTDYKSRRLTLCAPDRVLITTNLYPTYDYGDFIEVSGELESPPLIVGFDYEKYLARYDIYSVMYYPKINHLSGKLKISQEIYLYLLKIKWRVREVLNLSLPEPEAGLANALLLGYRRTVARDDLAIFARVGLSHMIAISGSHITILSALIMNFFLVLGVKPRRLLLVILGFLILYPLITGLSASAVRSAIMGGLVFLTTHFRKNISLLNALVFSGAIMLAFNPRLLRDDIGFQLSFLALLGIIYFYPIGETFYRRLLANLVRGRKIRKFYQTILDTINLTLVSQLVILPIALINFQQFSIIAPVANILVLWTFAPLLAALILGILISVWLPTPVLFLLGPWLFWPADLLLKFIFLIAKFLAQPPGAALKITGFTWEWGTVYYLVLAILVMWWHSRHQIQSKLGK